MLSQGKLIRSKRKAQGLSLRALADITHVNYVTLSKLERDLAPNPSENTKSKINRWLKTQEKTEASQTLIHRKQEQSFDINQDIAVVLLSLLAKVDRIETTLKQAS